MLHLTTKHKQMYISGLI